MKQILFLLAAVLLLGGCAEEKKTDVRWATFNVRYDNPQDSLNNWQYRKDRVCQFIKDRELDIVDMRRFSIVRTNMRCWTPILSGWPKIPIA